MEAEIKKIEKYLERKDLSAKQRQMIEKKLQVLKNNKDVKK